MINLEWEIEFIEKTLSLILQSEIPTRKRVENAIEENQIEVALGILKLHFEAINDTESLNTTIGLFARRSEVNKLDIRGTQTSQEIIQYRSKLRHDILNLSNCIK